MQRVLPWFLLVFCCLSAAATSPSPADQIKMSSTKEYRKKANFLFNLAKFTNWPGEFLAPDDRFELCVLGNDPFGLILELLAIRGMNGHEVDIRRPETHLESKGCHVLFVAEDVGASMGLMPRDLTVPGRLLVGDTPGFANRGGIANLLADGADIGFEININAAKRADLVLNTQLLRLGQLVNDDDISVSQP